MSESAPESNSGGNVFTRKLGPLPMWGWMAVVALVAIGYYFLSSKSSSSSSSNAANAANAPGGVDSSLVPQFVNQVYNQETPPPAPNVTVNNTIPTSTPTPPDNDHPAPTPAPGKKVTYINYTVRAGDTMQTLSKRYHVTPDQIADVPGNVYVKGEVPGDKKVGQQLGSGAGLKTGMKIRIPQYS